MSSEQSIEQRDRLFRFSSGAGQVRQGRQLGIEGPFLAEVLEVARKLAAEAGFKNVVERKESIEQELVREESRFLTTLDRGESRLGEVLQSAKEEGG